MDDKGVEGERGGGQCKLSMRMYAYVPARRATWKGRSGQPRRNEIKERRGE